MGVPQPKTLLVIPPIWTPIYPPLGIAMLTGYLRRAGFEVYPYDANQDFFLDHLLGPGTREDCSGPFRVLRDPQGFFEPRLLIQAQQRIREALQRISDQEKGWRISFTSLGHPPLGSLPATRNLCETDDNPFRRFCDARLSEKIHDVSPHIVGISLSTPYQLVPTLTMGRYIKNTFPEAKVVVGGKYCLAVFERILQEPRYFREFFDGVIPHQGESPLASLIRALAQGSDWGCVPGLAYAQNGAVRVNPPGPRISLRDLPPPDFDGLDLKRYLIPRAYLPVRFSSACYWGRCTFCSRQGEPQVELLPVDKAVQWIEHHVSAFGARDIPFNDDCLPPSYLEKLCRRILERGLDLSIQLYGRAVKGFTARRLKLLSRAGVREIRWGIESGHPRTLRLMDKGTDPREAGLVLRRAADEGIWNHACLILGFPGETRSEAMETLHWIESHRDAIHSYFLFEFHLNNESTIYHDPKRFSIEHIEEEAPPFSTVADFSSNRGMDRAEVAGLVKTARKKFLNEVYRHPFWYYARDREYLQLYLERYGRNTVLNWHVVPQSLTLTRGSHGDRRR